MYSGRLFLIVALLFATFFARAEETVRIGILSFRPKPQTMAQWQPLEAALRARMPEQRFVVQAYTYTELNEAVARRQLDFVLTNPGHYVLLSRRFQLSSPIATLLSGGPDGMTLGQFGGVILSRADGPLLNLADLAGQRIAVSSIESLGGYQMQAFEMKEAGVPLPSAEQMVITGMPHDKVVEALLDGRADAGFVRTGVLEQVVREGRIDPARLRVINEQSLPGFPYRISTRLYPEWPVAALQHVDAGLSSHVAAALLTLGDQPGVLESLNIRGFVVPVDYTPIVDLLRELRMPPFDRRPTVTFSDIVRQYRYELAAIALALLAMLALYARLLQTRRELRKQNRAMSNVIWGTGVGTWEWNVQSGETRFNRRWAEMLGYRLEDLEPTTIDTLNNLVHPDDATAANELLRRHFAGESDHYECEVRMQHRDGRWIWLLDRGKVLSWDRDGKPLLMAGTHLEISKRKAAEEKLLHYQQNLERLIEQRTQDLSVAKEAAEAASRAKTAFLANIGHELRTPMHGILGMLSLALRRVEDEKSRRNLLVAEVSAQRLLEVVNNVLDIARLEGDKLSLQAEPFFPGAMVDELRDTLLGRFAEKGLHFHVELSPELQKIALIGDGVRVRQILLNLLHNALAFTAQGGVDLVVRRLADSAGEVGVHFAVRDSGVGIPIEDQTRIFDAFEQGDNSSTRQYGGTGLGLAISHRLVSLMGGELRLVSQPGAGSLFSFDLSFHPAETDAQADDALVGQGADTKSPVTGGN